MTAPHNYSNTASIATLQAAINNSQLTMAVNTFTGFPAVPFWVQVDRNTGASEIMEVTGVAASTLTVVRGQGGTVATSHGLGATVEHVIPATVPQASEAHVAATTNVHGVAGTLVSTTSTGTVQNKTFRGGHQHTYTDADPAGLTAGYRVSADNNSARDGFVADNTAADANRRGFLLTQSGTARIEAFYDGTLRVTPNGAATRPGIESVRIRGQFVESANGSGAIVSLNDGVEMGFTATGVTGEAFVNGVPIFGSPTRMAVGVNSSLDAVSRKTLLFMLPSNWYLHYTNDADPFTALGGFVRGANTGARIGYANLSGVDTSYIDFGTADITIAAPGDIRVDPGTPITGTAGISSSARFGLDAGTTPIRFNWTGSNIAFVRDDTNVVVKTFVIDHPADADRYLVHATTESPHNGVEYWGTVELTGNDTVVELPPYFEALTAQHGRAVFLTPIVEDTAWFKVPVMAATYPQNGRFTIKASSGGHLVSWQVKAIRKDVPKLETEPLKDSVTPKGTGPYRYLVPKK